MNRLLIALLLFTTIQLQGQQLPEPAVAWEKSFGGKRYDEATDIIENIDGNLVLVGQCKNLDTKKDKTQKDINKLDKTGNSDLLFLVASSKGDLLQIKAIGRSKSERGNALVQTFDGGYAIAGFTNSKAGSSSDDDQKAFGLKDAWLLKVDEKGNYLWEIRLGSAAEDWFTDIVQDDEGNLFLTGVKNGRLYLVKVNQYGELQWEKTPISSTKRESKGNALVLLDNNDIAIAGLSKKGHDEKAVFIRTSADGVIKGDPVSYKADYEEATDIIKIKNNDLVLLSKTYNKKKADHVGVRLINSKGKLLTEEQFRMGDRQKDFPFAVLQSFSGDLLITGGSKSHTNTGVRHKAFLSRVDLSGQSRYEKWAQFYGGDATDKANQIIQASDGSVYLAGHTFSEKITGHNSDVYLIKIKRDKFPSSDKANGLEIENKNFIDADRDGLLRTDERSYYQFQIKNNGPNDAFKIVAKVAQNNNLAGIDYPKKIILGYLPAGHTKTYSVPLKGMPGLRQGEADFTVSFEEANQSKIPSFDFKIETINEPEAILSIISHKFSRETELQRETPITLKVSLKNTGDKVANSVRGVFSFERNVINISDKVISIPELAPDETHVFSVDFSINKVYQGDNTEVGFRFSASEEKYFAGIQNYYPLQTDLETLTLPSLSVSGYNISPSIDEIKKGDELDISVSVTNTGQIEAYDLQGNFAHNDATLEGLAEKSKKHTIIKGGETKTFSYKFKVKESATAELAILSFNFNADNKTLPSYPNGLVERFEIPIKNEKEPPVLSIASHSFNNSTTIAKRGEELLLKVDLKNTGGATEPLVASFETKEGITVLSEKNIPIQIGVNENASLSFQFKVNDDFNDKRIVIPFILKDKSGTAIALEKEFIIGVEELSPPKLLVKAHSFKPNIAKIGEEVNLSVTIENIGESIAKNVITEFLHGDQIEGLSEVSETNAEINSGTSKVLNYRFKVSEAFEAEDVAIIFRYKTKQINDGKFQEEEFTCALEKQKPVSLEVVNTLLSPEGYQQERDKEITLQIELLNTGEKTAVDVEGLFEETNNVIALSSNSETGLSIKPGERHRFEYRFKVEKAYEGSLVLIPFSYTCKSKKGKRETRETPISLNVMLPPQLLISRLNSKGGNSDIDGYTINIEIKNNGGRAATGIIGKFGFERNIEALNDKNVQIPTLEPGESKTLSFAFKPNSAFRGSSTNISFRFQGNEEPYVGGVKQSFAVHFANAKPVVATIFDPTWEAPLKHKRSIKGLGEEAHLLEIKLDIYSNLKINKDNFEVFLDGISQKGSKAGEDDLIDLSSKRSKSSGKKYKYVNKVLVPKGEHQLTVKYNDSGKVYPCETITVNYKPRSLNLHLLAIGINHYEDERNISSLSYPSQDVKDMEKIFKAQEGILFDEVNTTLVCDDCDNNKTTKRGLEIALSKFANDKNEKFGENDLIVIYISSHGKDFNGKFKILPSDYERDIEDVDGSIYTVDFDAFVIKKLKRLDSNHKFLFVDACHSGTAGEDLDNFNLSKSDKEIQSLVLKELIDKAQSINPMMSCLDYEKSWEHPDWKNGAFTEGMIEAFENRKVPVEDGTLIQASTDDTILTFGELYRFLQRRVPFIVKEKFKSTQTPYIPEKLVNDVEDLKFYIME